MTSAYKDLNEYLKPAKSGDYEISTFTITNKDIRAAIEGITAGDYVRLTYKGEVLMSNTPMEKRTNYSFVSEAHGDVLIGGLGIGLILMAIQDNDNVNSITVIEYSQDVIDLVASQLPLNNKVKIINGDVFKWKPEKGQKFDCIYMDIWPWVNSDVYKEEMVPLKRKFSHYMKPKDESPERFCSCWAEYEAKRNMRLY